MSATQRSTLTRRGFLGVSGAAALTVLAGCTRAATASHTGDGLLRVGLPADVNPATFTRSASTNFGARNLVLETLLRYDVDTLAVKPNLASAFQFNEAQTELRLTLRDDVLYHSGRRFEVADAIFSLKLATEKLIASQLAFLAKAIIKYTQTGPHELTLTLAKPITNFLQLLCSQPVFDRFTVAEIASGETIIGTGPFKWVRWVPESSVSLARNDHYWQPGVPHYRRVMMQVLGQEQAMLNAVRANQVDLAFQMVARDAATLASDSLFHISTTAPQFTDWMVGINVEAAPFTNLDARRAVAYGLDRERISSEVFSRYAYPSCIPWASTAPGLGRSYDSYFPFDLQRARQYFKAAGSPREPIPILVEATSPTMTSVFNIVQYNLAEVGFRVAPMEVDNTEYQTDMIAGSTKGLYIGLNDNAAISVAGVLQGSQQLKLKKNASHFTTPEFKALGKKLFAATSHTAIASATRELTDYVLQQAVHLTVAHSRYVTVSHRGIIGASHDALGYLNLTNARPIT